MEGRMRGKMWIERMVSLWQFLFACVCTGIVRRVEVGGISVRYWRGAVGESFEARACFWWRRYPSSSLSLEGIMCRKATLPTALRTSASPQYLHPPSKASTITSTFTKHPTNISPSTQRNALAKPATAPQPSSTKYRYGARMSR